MKVIKFRLLFVTGIITLCFILVIARLFHIQILQSSKYAQKSRMQSKYRAIIHAKRGSIKDRSARVLAKNIAHRLSLDANLIAKNSNDLKLVHERKQGSYDSIKRIYPYGELASSLLGYIGKDRNGLSGLEYAFDKYLRGEDGWSIIHKDGRNNTYERIGMPKKQPIHGCDIYLTIDVQIQKILENILTQTVKKFEAIGGMGMIMDPHTGDILAMANVPSFNPHFWKLYSAQRRKNQCISYNYEPGSTFKVITAAAALQEKIKSEKDTINGNRGIYKIYKQVIRDHKAYGKLTFSQALSYSSNVCFAKISDELGNERLYKYTKDFGLGTYTGLDLPGEEVGIVHAVDKWSGRTRVTMAMGQEVSVTLLQMMVVFSTIANGGLLIEPRILEKIVNQSGSVVKAKEFKVKRRVVSRTVATRLRKMMKGVVDYGTAKKCSIPGLAVAGKTGTSQKIDKETGAYSNKKYWSSFIGFVPVNNPELVCGIVIDEPSKGEAGGAVAGPAFKQIIRQMISQPELAYAEKLMKKHPRQQTRYLKFKKKTRDYLPEMTGMKRDKVLTLLTEKGISYELVGTGQTITGHVPRAGKKYQEIGKVILYTDDMNTSGSTEHTNINRNNIVVPNCLGKDLRDAVNILNMEGLVPYISGTGVVKKQFPVSGTQVKSTVICTLVCIYGG